MRFPNRCYSRAEDDWQCRPRACDICASQQTCTQTSFPVSSVKHARPWTASHAALPLPSRSSHLAFKLSFRQFIVCAYGNRRDSARACLGCVPSVASSWLARWCPPAGAAQRRYCGCLLWPPPAGLPHLEQTSCLADSGQLPGTSPHCTLSSAKPACPGPLLPAVSGSPGMQKLTCRALR